VERNKIATNLDEIKKNPYILYGNSMVSYFNLIRNLIMLYGFISFIAIIQMGVYWGARGLKNIDGYNVFMQANFGNMGFAGEVCSKNQIDWSQESTQLSFIC
jgi:hypothetical protein